MGLYISQSSIENIFGVNNIKHWSNLDNTDLAVDTTRVSLAISWAEEHVNNRFRNGLYSIPFSTIPQEVINWCATLAGIWLYQSRGMNDENEEGNKLTRLKVDIERQISECLAGMTTLDAIRCSNSVPSAPVIIP